MQSGTVDHPKGQYVSSRAMGQSSMQDWELDVVTVTCSKDFPSSCLSVCVCAMSMHACVHTCMST